MDRGSWVFEIGNRVYLWPRGAVVHVYQAEAYLRRLSGEVHDAQPQRGISVNGFPDVDAFRDWCRDEDKAMRQAEFLVWVTDRVEPR